MFKTRLKTQNFNESLVNEALAKIGYTRFENEFTIPDNVESPDYYRDGIVIELKTLEKEALENPDRIDRIGEVLREITKTGKIKKVSLSRGEIEDDLYDKYWDTFFDGLKTLLKKGRSQIRSAKGKFDSISAGVLFLVNVECDSFEHLDLHRYTLEVIKRKYPEIDGLISLTLIPQATPEIPGDIIIPTEVHCFNDQVTEDILLEIPNAIIEALTKMKVDLRDDLPPDYKTIRGKQNYKGTKGNTYSV